ncbi:MAG: AfsR/SARP family transcriptional regulator, partial [Acidimicrobiia bacterium]
SCLTHAGAPVSQDTLIEEVWGSDPPEAAKQTPHSYVSTLRKALGGVLRFTPLDTDEVIGQARAALTRELTDDECRQYLHTDGCQD